MKNDFHKIAAAAILSASAAGMAAQEQADTVFSTDLDEFVVVKRKAGVSGLTGPETGFSLSRTELFRAACCNLGESFTTNPSVDVDYADPATGAKQIKLLGLAGQYVQMMTENLPAFRGAAMPYAFRYIPGPWMKSIRVSKGSSTVKNGYEAITGQIDVEYLKPQDEEKVNLNAYIDSELKSELNADANFHLGRGLNTEVLGHYEDRYMNHDANDDGFADMPRVRQLNFQNRWNYFSDKYIMHAGVGFVDERSRAGQIHGNHDVPYCINLDTRRYDAYMKHAFIIDRERNANIAFAGNFSMHELDASYGRKLYDVNEKSVYAQLMYEADFTDAHNLSAGLSLSHDYLGQNVKTRNDAEGSRRINEKETTAGAYAQYTFKAGDMLTAMAGVRGDYSTEFGWFATPRLNVSYSPWDMVTFKGSAGKGWRTVHPWAEFNYLMASGRELVVEELRQEEAWNYGLSAEFRIPAVNSDIKVNAEYFHTDFKRQAVTDYDSRPGVILIADLKGKSYSNTFQIDASYDFSFGLSATVAYRLNDVKTTYGGRLMEKALTSRYKTLCSLSYKTPLELWQFDATFVLNGGGRMPAPYMLSDGEMSWGERFPAFPSLNVQVTRWFRHFSIYVGGENLTNFRQKNPVVGSGDPWSREFDPTVIWGPVSGAMVYAGIRFSFR